jgi:alpha-beta hydrolase superfamily lysophospholipase
MKTWAPGDAMPAAETPGYLPHQGESLYVVRHTAAPSRPRGAVVLAGPMSLERSHAMLTWVRWARNLAANGFEAWRFDYRGVGESTGDFRTQTFDTWSSDLGAVLDHVRAQQPPLLVVLGLRLGALLAQRAFANGAADGVIAWEPPSGGKPMLMDMLRRKLAADYMELASETKKTRDDYVRGLEAGEVVEVEGYPWSRELWLSSAAYAFGPASSCERVQM